jgi:hypothetical protein
MTPPPTGPGRPLPRSRPFGAGETEPFTTDAANFSPSAMFCASSF